MREARATNTSARRTNRDDDDDEIPLYTETRTGTGPEIGGDSPEQFRSARATPGGGTASSTGPNLRGSINREQAASSSANANTNTNGNEYSIGTPRAIRYTIERERDPKVSVTDLPEHLKDFDQWFYDLCSSILASGLPIVQSKEYVRGLREDQHADLPCDNMSEMAQLMDLRIFDNLMKAMNKKLYKYKRRVRKLCIQGCGRQALRVLSAIYLHERTKLTSRMVKEIVRATCTSVEQLGDFVELISSNVDICRENRAPVQEEMILELMKEKLKPYQKGGVEEVRSVYALFDSRLPQERTLDRLLKSLEQVADSYREAKEQEREAKGGAGAPQVVCAHCKKEGHTKKECYQLNPHLKPGGEKGGPGRGKGGGKDRSQSSDQSAGADYQLGDGKGKKKGGKKGGGKGKNDTFPPCTHCGRCNHAPQNCWFQPDGDGSVGAAGWQSSSSSAAPVNYTAPTQQQQQYQQQQQQPKQKNKPGAGQPSSSGQPTAAEVEAGRYLSWLNKTGACSAIVVYKDDVSNHSESPYELVEDEKVKDDSVKVVAGAVTAAASRGDLPVTKTTVPWMWDTGASRVLLDPDTKIGKTHNDRQLPEIDGLRTFGGQVSVATGSDVNPPALKGPKKTAIHVPGTGMNAVSAGEYVEDDDYEFHWTKQLGAWVVPPEAKPYRPPTAPPTEYDVKLVVHNKIQHLPDGIACAGRTVEAPKKEQEVLEGSDDESDDDMPPLMPTRPDGESDDEDDNEDETVIPMIQRMHTDDGYEFVACAGRAPYVPSVTTNPREEAAKHSANLFRMYHEFKAYGGGGDDDVEMEQVDEGENKEMDEAVSTLRARLEDELRVEEENEADANPLIPEKKHAAWNHLKYEGARADHPDIPPGHDLTHYPPHHKCVFCLFSKLQKTPVGPSRKDVEFDIKQIQEYLKLVHADLMKVRVPDHKGCTQWLDTLDQASRYPRGDSQKGKEPAITASNFTSLYQGTVWDEPKRFPSTVSTDRGPEFLEEFDEMLEKRGATHRMGLARRSKSMAHGESNVKITQRGMTCQILRAGMTSRFWSLSARHFNHNIARTRLVPDPESEEMVTAYRIAYRREFRGTLYPWGCAATYLNDDVDKCEARGLPGIIVMYGPGGSMEIMELQPYRARRLIKTIITKDFQADTKLFPGRLLHRPEEMIGLSEEEVKLTPLFFEDDAPNTYEYRGRLLCKQCHLWVTDEPLTCPACLDSKKKHGKGAPQYGCKRKRCQGQGKPRKDDDDDDDDDDNDEGGVRSKRGASSSSPNTPRRRLEGKQDLAGTPYASPRGALDHSVVAPATPAEPPPATPPVPPTPIPAAEDAPITMMPPMLGGAKEACDMASRSAQDAVEVNRVYREAAVKAIQQYQDKHHNQKNLEEKTYQRIRTSFGAVAKILTRAEVRQTPAAQEANKAELVQVSRTKRAFNLNAVDEWSNIKRKFPNAKLVRGMFVTVQKGVEKSDASSLKRYKGRLVAIGSNIRNVDGDRVIDRVRHVMPASLNSLRVLLSWETVQKNGVTVADDAPGAYLNEDLSGDPIFITFDKAVCAMYCPEWLNYELPCTRVDKALYGLHRSDSEWGLGARRRFKNCGMTHITDIGEDSVYLSNATDLRKYPLPIMSILYTDDIASSGEEIPTLERQETIREVLEVVKGPGELLDYIGLERLLLKPLRPCHKRLVLHQCDYMENVVREYEVKYFNGQTLRSVGTPALTTEPKNEEVPDWVPYLEKDAPHIVGQVSWGGRGSRPDVVATCKRIAGRFTKWQRSDDAVLHRLMQYLRGHINYGILIEGDHNDLPKLKANGFADADHFGDPASTKSTNGYAVCMVGPNSKMPQTWGAKSQQGCPRNTPEAELISLDYMMHEAALPLSLLWQRLLGRAVAITALEDNTTAIAIVRKGYSRKLGYLLAKADKVAVSSLHELFVKDPDDLDSEALHTLEYLQTKMQVADVFTKPLEYDSHWWCCRELGLVVIPWELPNRS